MTHKFIHWNSNNDLLNILWYNFQRNKHGFLQRNFYVDCYRCFVCIQINTCTFADAREMQDRCPSNDAVACWTRQLSRAVAILLGNLCAVWQLESVSRVLNSHHLRLLSLVDLCKKISFWRIAVRQMQICSLVESSSRRFLLPLLLLLS